MRLAEAPLTEEGRDGKREGADQADCSPTRRYNIYSDKDHNNNVNMIITILMMKMYGLGTRIMQGQYANMSK